MKQQKPTLFLVGRGWIFFCAIIFLQDYNDQCFFWCKCMYTALTLCEIFSFPEIFFLKFLNTFPVPKSKSSRSQKQTG